METITRSIAMADFRCYVADLAAYNAGHLVGEWVDLDGLSADEMREAVAGVIRRSPFPGAEEYAIHDWDGLPSTFGEWPDWEAVADYVAAMESLTGAEEQEAFELWRANYSGDSVDDFRDVYCGCYDSGADYAEELAGELGCLPDPVQWPLSCIDWKGAWQELRIGGDNWGERGSHGFHVFRNC